MSEPVIAPAAPVEPIAPPIGADTGIEPAKKTEAIAEDPFEFELDVKGKKEKIKFSGKDQMKAVLQKALYADQVIKDASQAKKGAEALMQKLKTPQGLREVLTDPDINVDMKKFALDIVREMMDDEKLTPEQREAREWKTKAEKLQAAQDEREAAEKNAKEKAKNDALAIELRGEIVGAMKKYPDIPQSQATMDGVIQNMRAAFRRFGKHLTAEQAMSVYSEQYWKSLGTTIDTMPEELILKRFGQKTLDKIQRIKLKELQDKTNPARLKQEINPEIKKKKNLTEKEFEKHFDTLAGL